MQQVIKHIAARARQCCWSLCLSPTGCALLFPRKLSSCPDVCVKTRDSQILPYLAAWGGQSREHILLAELTYLFKENRQLNIFANLENLASWENVFGLSKAIFTGKALSLICVFGIAAGEPSFCFE